MFTFGEINRPRNCYIHKLHTFQRVTHYHLIDFVLGNYVEMVMLSNKERLGCFTGVLYREITKHRDKMTQLFLSIYEKKIKTLKNENFYFIL